MVIHPYKGGSWNMFRGLLADDSVTLAESASFVPLQAVKLPRKSLKPSPISVGRATVCYTPYHLS